MTMGKAKVTILTPSYQQARYIEQNILSVLGQDYQPLEHIVVDGGSTDTTIDVLKKYPRLTWVSEKDEGQADALDKGLKMATGDIVGWINSDDYYLPNCIHSAVAAFEDSNVQWVVGNILIAYEAVGKTVREKSPRVTYETLIADPDILRQQATFFRRSFLEQAGSIDKSFHLVMDCDLWIRLAKLSPPKMVDEYWAVFRMQPEQKTSGRTLLRQLGEIQTILSRERAPFFDQVRILSRKLVYYVKYRIKMALIVAGLIDKAYSGAPYSIRHL